VTPLEEDEEPEKTLEKVEQNFVDAVAEGKMDLGAPLMNAMSDNRVIRTDYESQEQGRDGNLWDDLIQDQEVNDQTEETEDSEDEQIDDSSNILDDDSRETVDEQEELVEEEQNISQTQATRIVTKEVVSPEMTDSVKYLIVFLAVISIALVIVIGYIAIRMCSRTHIKPARQPSITLQPQFVIEEGDAKDIFSSRRRKQNEDLTTVGGAPSQGGALSHASS